MTTRFQGQIFNFTQPDGSPIQLRGWGDQYYARFETLDGYAVTQNPATGRYEVASLTADGNSLQPAPGPGGALDGAGAGVPRGLRVRRESAIAAGRASALTNSGRRCEQRRQERRQQARALRSAAAAQPCWQHPPKIVAIPYERTTLPGYFFRADGDDRSRATVILLGGCDGTAEEM